jgi:hypothetical protein
VLVEGMLNIRAPTVPDRWSLPARLGFTVKSSWATGGGIGEGSLPPVNLSIALARAACELDLDSVARSPRVGKGLGVFLDEC